MAKKVKWFGKQVEAEMLGRVGKALHASGAHLERTMKLSMKKGTGKVYVKKSVKHRASAEGEPPAVDLGRLRASITWQTSDGRGSTPDAKAQPNDGMGQPFAAFGEIVCVVGTSVEYADDLELGTPKIRPRPFVRPALENSRGKILSFFGFGSS